MKRDAGRDLDNQRTRSDARLIAAGVDGIMSDYPDRLVSVLHEK